MSTSPSFPAVRPRPLAQNFTICDGVILELPTRPIGVAAGEIINPGDLLVVDTASPLTARVAVTGEPVTPGTNLIGIASGLSTATATVAGEVLYFLKQEGMTVRGTLNNVAQTPVVGSRYAIISTVDANGNTIQKVNTSAAVATADLLCVEFDSVTKKAVFEIL
jgi:hypothetical protein